MSSTRPEEERAGERKREREGEEGPWEHRGREDMEQFGDDEFGHMLVNILKQNGVNAEGCLFDQHARTALAFVTLKKNGEREFMFYRNPSADMLLTEAELNLDLIRRAKIFHYGSISLISEPCRGAPRRQGRGDPLLLRPQRAPWEGEEGPWERRRAWRQRGGHWAGGAIWGWRGPWRAGRQIEEGGDERLKMGVFWSKIF